MTKELVPIVVSCAVWGALLQHKNVKFHCDNQGLMEAINKGSSKEETMMYLIRCLWFFTAVFDIHITATHIAGIANNAADMLSRNQSDKILMAFPQISTSPTPLSQSLFHLVSPPKLDWTSHQFRWLFKKTYYWVQIQLTP